MLREMFIEILFIRICIQENRHKTPDKKEYDMMYIFTFNIMYYIFNILV